jgi:hypothetical protein
MNPEYFFCPNNNCHYSKQYSYEEKWYKKDGFHPTKAFGDVQRYRCLYCGRTFSDQTFSLNYYLKRKTDFKVLLPQLISCNSSCFIARDNDLSFESIRIRRDRMARNAMFMQTKLLEGHRINEALAADGFESYTRSKYFPVYINVLMGCDSDFMYSFSESHIKRKGKTTERQKERMNTEYENISFTGCDLQKQFRTLLDYLTDRCADDKCVLHTDEHKTYLSVLKELSGKAGFPEVTHIQTSSRKARNALNPLRSVNYIDRLYRKDIPNHRRKTICFARNDRNMLSRMALYMLTHNFYKPRRISDKARQTEEKHYSVLGLDEKKLGFWKSLFRKQRFFLSKIELPEYFQKVWKRITETPFGENWYPLPKFALD